MSLHFHDLTIERNDTFLFRGMNCTLESGDLLAVYGENGSGKSTLLRMLAGYIRPETGSILWCGQNIFQLAGDYITQLNYLGHQNAIKLHLTAFENLALQTTLFNLEIQSSQLKNYLQAFQLEQHENILAMHLSAGQKRRLALLRLVLNPKPLWILDEPVTALDKSGKELFNRLLRAHLEKGGMAIVATHDILDIENIKTLDLTVRDESHV